MSTHISYDAFIGLDVHKETIATAIANPDRSGEIRFWGNIPNTPDSIRRLFTKLSKNYPTMLVCYETGSCGYQVYRQLTSMSIECQVIAPSRIPKSPTDRIKNDHRDAMSLARLLRAGDLTTIWVPDESHEAMRDLVRARTASKKDTKISRQRIQSMLLRAGRLYDKKILDKAPSNLACQPIIYKRVTANCFSTLFTSTGAIRKQDPSVGTRNSTFIA